MQSVLHKLRGVPVTVVGDAVVDRYILGITSRISREAPVPVVRYEAEEVRAGGAANAAVNLGALELRATLICLLGRDEAGMSLRRLLKARRVAVRAVSETGRATAVKTRILAGAQGTRRQQVLRLDVDPVRPPRAPSLQALARLMDAAPARAWLISDYGHGLMDGPVLELMAERARQGLPVVVDSRHGLSRVRGPVVLKPNAPELEGLAGAPVQDTADVVAAARAVVRRLGAAAVVATRGNQGMVVVERSREPVVIAAHGRGEVTDVTGAGDTVAAALTGALAAGVSLPMAARLANVAASVVVQKLGAATASPEEILAELAAG